MNEVELTAALTPYYEELGNAILIQAVRDYIAGSLVQDCTKDLADISESLARFRAAWHMGDIPFPQRQAMFRDWIAFNDTLTTEARIRTNSKSFIKYATGILEAEIITDALPFVSRIRQKLLNKDDTIKEHIAMQNWPNEVKAFVHGEMFPMCCKMSISPAAFIRALDRKVKEIRKNGGYVGKTFYSAEAPRKGSRKRYQKGRPVRAYWLKGQGSKKTAVGYRRAGRSHL